MERDDFFRNLFENNTPEADAIRAQRQLAYEERIIKRILTECGAAPASWGALVNTCRRESHEDKLNFGWFNSFYRQFPGQLCGKRIPFMHQITLVDLFKPVGKNRVVKAVSKALAALSVDPVLQPYVLVFPIVKTQFCAHTVARVAYDPVTGTNRMQFSIQSPAGVSSRPLFIEPLKTFCAALGNQWAL
jgi:hypothetical protein